MLRMVSDADFNGTLYRALFREQPDLDLLQVQEAGDDHRAGGIGFLACLSLDREKSREGMRDAENRHEDIPVPCRAGCMERVPVRFGGERLETDLMVVRARRATPR